MKKIRFYLVLVAILSLVLVGCGKTEEVNTKRELTEVAALKTDQNVLVFSTLSGANALSDVNTLKSSLNSEAPLLEDKEVEIDMEKANSYLLMMENILADGGPIVSSETESDREGYDSMMVITVKDLAGNISSYTLYYSIVVEEDETLPEEETTTDENTEVENNNPDPAYRGGWNNHDDRDDHDDEDHKHDEHHDKAHDQFKHHIHGDKEDEVEYDINALAVIDGVEYEVFGKKEVEEDENEVEIKFIIRLDEENFVRIEQEIEEDEVEYKYEIFKNGRIASSLSFDSEEEDGNTFIKLTTTNDSGERETYKFIKGKDVTIVKYESRGYSYTLVVTASVDADGNIVYDYKVKEKEGFKWNHKKGPKGDKPLDQPEKDTTGEQIL